MAPQADTYTPPEVPADLEDPREIMEWISKNTFTFYETDPERRATTKKFGAGHPGNNCAYLTPCGTRRCAVGRFLKPGDYSESMEGNAFDPELFEGLVPLSDHDEFWGILQKWHDAHDLWGAPREAASAARAFRAEEILGSISEGEYDL